MTVLFGHPTGNPNSHHAALAHYEAGWLEAFCLPWMPTEKQLHRLQRAPGLRGWAARLERRRFAPLALAPRVEGQWGEWQRMLQRVSFPKHADERLSYAANDWLMRTMARESQRRNVTAVHAYEDCSLWQFEAAKRQGKACIYDMPIGFYPAWEARQQQLAREYADWLPPEGLPASHYVRPAQKQQEMALADLVLAPSSFVMKTIAAFYPDKPQALAPYGVDLAFWQPPAAPPASHRPLRFLYAGQVSIRKGIPVLIEAWRKAALPDAQLELIGHWGLAAAKQHDLPHGVTIAGPASREALRAAYQQADVFVFPSFFEGFGLVILEAMACGLPVIATDATAGPDILDETTGRIVEAGQVDELVAVLRWFAAHREQLPAMRRAARAKAETCTWDHYRRCVRDAVAPVVGRN